MAQVIVRMETAEGMKSYIVEGQATADASKLVWKDMIDVCPAVLRPILQGFMFAARHGPLQKLLREKGLPEMCKTCGDKDAEAVSSFIRLLFHSAQEEQLKAARPGEPLLPFDVFQKDLAEASQGMIIRAPEYDGLARVEPPQKTEQPALTEPVPAV